ncbi:MAG: class beta-lactamase-related serine hydrolase [Herbinix sp.]|jgi:CubicO group peptidase (beta-lactamase class C family)|nr:class beta-lactamase-related serine hydrolase [Herbinix sp.]
MSELYQLKRSTPELQGVTSEAILNFIQEVEKIRSTDMGQDIHSFMLLRHGYVIAEGCWAPYESNFPHMLFSLSKSFTSTAIGFAVQEGKLSVEDDVVSYFPKECVNASENLLKMKIKHLLSMNTGHIVDTTDFFFGREDGNWVKAFFDVPVEKVPGTHFLYNTGATYMLSVILQKITGEKLIDYLQPRLFEPLSITGATWENCPMGYNTGGFGLRVKTEDIAKFGQLYLDNGKRNGKELLSEEWIREATAKQSDNSSMGPGDWGQGYGYQFWRCRHNAYRGDGAFGQYCIIMPEKDAVLAITGGMKDLQKPLEIAWDKLLPGFMEDVLPDSTDYESLKIKLSSLRLLMSEGTNNSAIENIIKGKSYCFEPNQLQINEMSLLFKEESISIHIKTEEQELELCAGRGQWISGTFLFDDKQEAIAITGSWENDTTLVLQGRLLHMPFAINLNIGFIGEELLLEQKLNVGFAEPQPVCIKGYVKS